MKLIVQIIFIVLIGFACSKNDEVISKAGDQMMKRIDEESGSRQPMEEDLEKEAYYGFDTLLVNQYRSESGHNVKLEGSKSGDIYRISVASTNGETNKFITADNWYGASHSFVVWDNLCAYACPAFDFKRSAGWLKKCHNENFLCAYLRYSLELVGRFCELILPSVIVPMVLGVQ